MGSSRQNKDPVEKPQTFSQAVVDTQVKMKDLLIKGVQNGWVKDSYEAPPLKAKYDFYTYYALDGVPISGTMWAEVQQYWTPEQVVCYAKKFFFPPTSFLGYHQTEATKLYSFSWWLHESYLATKSPEVVIGNSSYGLTQSQRHIIYFWLGRWRSGINEMPKQGVGWKWIDPVPGWMPPSLSSLKQVDWEFIAPLKPTINGNTPTAIILDEAGAEPAKVKAHPKLKTLVAGTNPSWGSGWFQSWVKQGYMESTNWGAIKVGGYAKDETTCLGQLYGFIPVEEELCSKCSDPGGDCQQCSGCSDGSLVCECAMMGAAAKQQYLTVKHAELVPVVVAAEIGPKCQSCHSTDLCDCGCGSCTNCGEGQEEDEDEDEDEDSGNEYSGGYVPRVPLVHLNEPPWVGKPWDLNMLGGWDNAYAMAKIDAAVNSGYNDQWAAIQEWGIDNSISIPEEMASFYLAEAIIACAIDRTPVVMKDPHVKQLCLEAQQVQDAQVTRLDPTFLNYGKMACWGELRHSSLIAGGDRARRWIAAHKTFGDASPEVYKDMTTMFVNWGQKGPVEGGYGGVKWGICSELIYLRLTNRISPTLWVDRVFSLQHNGGSFLNKIPWGGVMDYYSTRNNRQHHLKEAMLMKTGWDVINRIGEAHANRKIGWATLYNLAAPEVQRLVKDQVRAVNRARLSHNLSPLLAPDLRGHASAYTLKVADAEKFRAEHAAFMVDATTKGDTQ